MYELHGERASYHAVSTHTYPSVTSIHCLLIDTLTEFETMNEYDVMLLTSLTLRNQKRVPLVSFVDEQKANDCRAMPKGELKEDLGLLSLELQILKTQKLVLRITTENPYVMKQL